MILLQLENLERDLDVLMSLTTAAGGRDELSDATGVLLMAYEVWRRSSDFVCEHASQRDPSDRDGLAADEATREYLSVLEVRLDDQQRRLDAWEAMVVVSECPYDDDDDEEFTAEQDAPEPRLTATGSGPL